MLALVLAALLSFSRPEEFSFALSGACAPFTAPSYLDTAAVVGESYHPHGSPALETLCSVFYHHQSAPKGCNKQP